MRKVRMIAVAMTAGLSLATKAFADGDRRVGDERSVENRGTVCFMRGHTGIGAVVSFRPALGCLSSSCTLPLKQSFTVDVRQEPESEIAMDALSSVRVAPSDTICPSDCGGTGETRTTLTQLRAGTYRLTLGGLDIGKLDTERLKGDPFNRICFGTPRE